MPEIEADIEDVIKAIEYWPATHIAINDDVIKVLKETLRQEVFDYTTGNKSIDDKDEMRGLISAGKGTSAHRPSTPTQGPAYSSEYLRRKEKMGENMPHKYEEYGFWHGIRFKNRFNHIRMEADPPSTSEKQFDYLTLHEKKRSVLKLTFVLAWQRVIKSIIKKIGDKMQGK